MKKNIIIVVAVLLLVLAGGVYFINTKKTSVSDVKDSTQETNSPKSLKSLFSLGLTQKCTFDEGTVYVANGKMRGDFKENSHMIVDGTTSYVWTDGQNSGFKMTFDPNSIDASETNASVQSSIDYNQEVNYDCNNWSLDASVFELPKDIKFQDFSSLIPSANPEKSGSNTSQCGYCDGLDGDSKTQCLKALNCN